MKRLFFLFFPHDRIDRFQDGKIETVSMIEVRSRPLLKVLEDTLPELHPQLLPKDGVVDFPLGLVTRTDGFGNPLTYLLAGTLSERYNRKTVSLFFTDDYFPLDVLSVARKETPVILYWH